MIGIGIVDDREEQKEEITEAFEITLEKQSERNKKKWQLFPSVPLPKLQDYPFWIAEHKIAALIVDERLREVPTEHYSVDYDGHDVVGYLRPRMRNLPIFMVTSHPQDDALKTTVDEVTEIVGKEAWGQRREELTNEVFEKAEIFKKDYNSKLARIDQLAQIVALGTATPENTIELRALQIELQLPFTDIKAENDQWLSRIEEAVNKLEILEKDTKSFLESIKQKTDETP